MKTPVAKPNLGEITTRWSAVHDPAHFVVRYAPAIRNYLTSLVRDPHEVEDVLQEFLLGVTRNGFHSADQRRGRFRDYLFVSVRNAAYRHLQRLEKERRRKVPLSPDDLIEPGPSADLAWIDEWRQCLITRVLDALHRHEHRTPRNLAHTVLRVRLDLPQADSVALAEETSRRCGRLVRPDAYRQHLARARQLFGRFLITEVQQTLTEPTPDQLQTELSELGLIPYLRDCLEGA